MLTRTTDERRVRIAELQAELGQLLREETEANLADGAALIAECLRMANAGQKVEAVKLYRNRIGTSLREALGAIENFAGQQQAAA